jgi:hypothetical protein
LALGILESIQEQGLIGNLLEMEHNSAEYLHTLVEALRFSLPCLQHAIIADPDRKLEGSPLQVISFVILVGLFGILLVLP